MQQRTHAVTVLYTPPMRLIGDAAADVRGADEGAERGSLDVRVRYVGAFATDLETLMTLPCTRDWITSFHWAGAGGSFSGAKTKRKGMQRTSGTCLTEPRLGHTVHQKRHRIALRRFVIAPARASVGPAKRASLTAHVHRGGPGLHRGSVVAGEVCTAMWGNGRAEASGRAGGLAVVQMHIGAS